MFVLQRAVFQGLSQEALSACIQSLLKASDVIQKNKVRISRFNHISLIHRLFINLAKLKIMFI